MYRWHVLDVDFCNLVFFVKKSTKMCTIEFNSSHEMYVFSALLNLSTVENLFCWIQLVKAQVKGNILYSVSCLMHFCNCIMFSSSLFRRKTWRYNDNWSFPVVVSPFSVHKTSLWPENRQALELAGGFLGIWYRQEKKWVNSSTIKWYMHIITFYKLHY